MVYIPENEWCKVKINKLKKLRLKYNQSYIHIYFLQRQSELNRLNNFFQYYFFHKTFLNIIIKYVHLNIGASKDFLKTLGYSVRM